MRLAQCVSMRVGVCSRVLAHLFECLLCHLCPLLRLRPRRLQHSLVLHLCSLCVRECREVRGEVSVHVRVCAPV